MTKPYFDVLVIGTPCVDIVFGGLPHWPQLGIDMYCANLSVGVGNTFNAAATLSRLGLRVGLLCGLGNDFFSRYMLEQIDNAAISREFITFHDQPMFSVSVSLPYAGDRGFVSYSNVTYNVAVPCIGPVSTTHAQLEDTLVAAMQNLFDRYNFGALLMYAHPDLLPFINIMKASGARLFFDVGCNPQDTLAVVRHADFFMPNHVEAAKITGVETAEESARILAEYVPTAIITIGPRGVVACQQGELTYCATHPLEKEVIDTTGAGDAFDGGFIYGILKGYSLSDSLHCGTICGSLSTTALTGTAAVPTVEELESLRRQFLTQEI